MNSLTLRLGKTLVRSILWQTEETKIHLTFDDGPHPVGTPKILDVLKERNVRSTFFLIGNNVRQYPALTRRIVDEGHIIGNHTFHHLRMMFRSGKIQQSEIEQANEVIEQLTGTRPTFFRPPYGFFDHRTLSAAREANLRVVLWSIDPKDFKASSRENVVRKVIVNLHPGGIVLLHDNDFTRNTLAQTVNSIIDGIEAQGYSSTPLPL